MKIIPAHLIKKTPKEVDASCFMVVYKSMNGSWRAFAHPYDVTIEASTKKQAWEALQEMVEVYEAGLKKYDYPSHLAHKHLSDEEDNKKFSELAVKLMMNRGSINGADYHAEAKTVSA